MYFQVSFHARFSTVPFKPGEYPRIVLFKQFKNNNYSFFIKVTLIRLIFPKCEEKTNIKSVSL